MRDVATARVVGLLREGGAASLLLGVVVTCAAIAGRVSILAAVALGLVVAALGFATVVAGRREGRGDAGAAPSEEIRVEGRELAGPGGVPLPSGRFHSPALHVRAVVATGKIVIVLAVSAVIIELARGSIHTTPWAELGAAAALVYLLAVFWVARRAS
jgi:hypothetical protein